MKRRRCAWISPTMAGSEGEDGTGRSPSSALDWHLRPEEEHGDMRLEAPFLLQPSRCLVPGATHAHSPLPQPHGFSNVCPNSGSPETSVWAGATVYLSFYRGFP